MGMRGTYHIERIEELAEKFVIWRAERIPGPYAFQSTYDRVGISICKWLYQCIQATRAIHSFDYLLPLMVSMSLTQNNMDCGITHMFKLTA
jgi:proteasome activator subunit 4